MVKFLLALVFIVTLAQAQEESDLNQTQVLLEAQYNEEVLALEESIDNIVKELGKEGVLWQKSYNSYTTYLDVTKELKEVRKEIQLLSKKGRGIKARDELNALETREQILANQINLLQGKDSAPFKELLIPDELPEMPEVSNPVAIFTALSYIKIIEGKLKNYQQRQVSLRKHLVLLRKKSRLSSDLAQLSVDNDDEEVSREDMHKLIIFNGALETVEKASVLYAQRIDSVEAQIQKGIKAQTWKLFNLGIIIVVLLVLFLLAKLIIKKYITDNERIYMAHKMLTFVNFSLIIIIIAFSYIDNVSYIITVLGFASAGIAIAMKDWFMSILGWFVLLVSGSIHVGDRIRVRKEGVEYVGDVLDISLLRITILEDITLTTYTINRRAGRIIFIPNNYIFTTLIANYSHATLKTVWDGIDITITFDSNHRKAIHIAKEIARKYSKGYTDITRTQLNKLRNRYNLKNTNVEPRVFSFAEANGVAISAWYLTNAYATLTLRSTISVEIIEAYNEAEDIQIAYPTQTLHLNPTNKQDVIAASLGEDHNSAVEW
ncbi:mechanosensitive ion channel [Sulfurimonas sp. MAG313]|nr:mechanosensitive ion channel domain-containing protein [Sulfurimonas sp. MAG313]MDF1881409.1 mechanosensitive ion channel [Sulfurimonas sp. MAG313]